MSKAIDKAAGAEREVVRPKTYELRNEGGYSGGLNTTKPRSQSCEITAPASDDAKTWQGWGTALKPAHEPIVLARKPLAGTVAANVLAHGTGGMNIDGCRVACTAKTAFPVGYSKATGDSYAQDAYSKSWVAGEDRNPEGRWPPNILLTHTEGCRPVGTRRVRGSRIDKPCDSDDMASGYSGGLGGRRPARGHGDESNQETVAAWDCAEGCPVAEMDWQSGVLMGGAVGMTQHASGTNAVYGDFGRSGMSTGHRGRPDSGGASRFFPVFAWDEADFFPFRYQAKAGKKERPSVEGVPSHPTVKPVALMRWLVRLTTPPGGLVLDPFGGTGTTAQAAAEEGFRCLLIEKDDGYAKLVAARMENVSTSNG